MRVAGEICYRCGSPVFEDDIDSGAAIDELTRCLCPKCASVHRRPKLAPARTHPPAPQPAPSLPRIAALGLIALLLLVAIVYLHAAKPVPAARKAGGKRPVASASATSPGLSRGQVARLRRAVAELRVRRTLSNELFYRDTRDTALELMAEGKYRAAADVIEKYPEELRSGEAWEMRLSPLWREAKRLGQAAGEYAEVLTEAVRLAEKENFEQAAGVLRQYAGGSGETPWAGEASRLAGVLGKFEAAKKEAKRAAEKEAPVPAPAPRVPPAPKPAPLLEPEPKKPNPRPPDDKFQKKIQTAISRGVEYLKRLSSPDGSFRSSYSRSYRAGPTALALLALLKCGTEGKSEIAKRGFEYLKKKPLTRTYSVALYMLALAAKFEPRGNEIQPNLPFDEQLRKRFARHASPAEKRMVDSIVAWLRDAQCADGTWSYTGRVTSSAGPTTMGRGRPPGRRSSGDGSNTQFAVLALYTAHRLGAAIPENTVETLAKTFLESQQKSGTGVKPFPVPAADISIHQLRQKEKKALSRRGGPHTVSLDELYGGSGSRHRMYARGWGYSQSLRSGAYLSMTCAGVCNMVLAKAALERRSGYSRMREKVDKAIRDGAAYISKNLGPYVRSAGRSGQLGWGLYYTLYSVERTGMLTLCEKFGKHQWYKEGAEALLGLQSRNGSWGSSLEDTSFALLFLSRSTTPFIRTSGTIYTGEDLFGPKKK